MMPRAKKTQAVLSSTVVCDRDLCHQLQSIGIRITTIENEVKKPSYCTPRTGAQPLSRWNESVRSARSMRRSICERSIDPMRGASLSIQRLGGDVKQSVRAAG